MSVEGLGPQDYDLKIFILLIFFVCLHQVSQIDINMQDQLDIKQYVPERWTHVCEDIKQACGFKLYDIRHIPNVIGGRRKKSNSKTMGVCYNYGHEAIVFLNFDLCKTADSRMLTYIHEAAHAITPNYHKPHGRQWKNNHRKLLKLVADKQYWGDLWDDFVDYYDRSPATYSLVFDKTINGDVLGQHQVYLKDLEPGRGFEIEQKGEILKFKKISNRRTRCNCEDQDGNYFVISGTAEVTPIDSFEYSDEAKRMVALKTLNKGSRFSVESKGKRRLFIKNGSEGKWSYCYEEKTGKTYRVDGNVKVKFVQS